MQLNALAMATSAVLAFGSAPLHAQTWQMPPDNQRCPSKWGAADQRGSANMMKPESILRAAKLIKTGEVFELAAVLSPDPKEAFINANRVFNIYTKPALPVPNARVANEELIVSELGQIGTQFDAFAHQMWGDSFYNCFKLGDIGTRSGFKKLGVENVGSLIENVLPVIPYKRMAAVEIAQSFELRFVFGQQPFVHKRQLEMRHRA